MQAKADPSGGDDSDHEDHTSVVTYKDDEDELRQLSRFPPTVTAPGSAETNKKEVPPHPSSVSRSSNLHFETTTRPLTKIFIARLRLGDLCDSTAWEALFVSLNVCFLILVIGEVSIFSGTLGSLEGLRDLNATSAALLVAFAIEIILKTIAFDYGYWRVPRNIVDSLSIAVACAVQIATTSLLFQQPESFLTSQMIVASRVFRLLVTLIRQRRVREFYTAMRALRPLKDNGLSSSERTLGILKDIKNHYPLSDLHLVQLQWCINVIASHKLYSGFFKGPSGEPIRFLGVDEDTSKWLLGTYSRTQEDSVIPKSDQPKALIESKDAEQTKASATPPSPSLSSVMTAIVPPDMKLSRGLSRRDTDGADALLAGRRHTPLYLAGERTGAESPSEANTFATSTNSPLLPSKRTASKATMVVRGSDGNIALKLPKTSNLRRGSSFANQNEFAGDIEEGSAIALSNSGSLRIITGSALGFTSGDLDALGNLLSEDTFKNDGFAHLAQNAERMNKELDEWGFDIFALNDVSNGRPLSPILLACLRKNSLLDAFGNCISHNAVIRFALEIENGYIVDNPYHNRIHAADVVQCFHHFLTHRAFRDSLTPLDRLAGLVAAAVHDFRHPGKNNAFLVATKNSIAVQYNDMAVLENMHVASIFQIIQANPEIDIFSGLPPAGRAEARETIIQMVLATDMKAHFDILSQFKSQVVQSQASERTHDNLGAWWNEVFPSERDHSFSSTTSAISPLTAFPVDYRRTILKTGLHVADVSNPVRPAPLAIRWAELVQEEFFSQGDAELANNLTISMFMDRRKPALPKMQVGFIEFIVKPLAESFYGWLKSLRPIMEPCLLDNLEYWKKRQDNEVKGSPSLVASSSALTSHISMSHPPVPQPPSSEKVPNRFVARLRGTGNSTRHKTTASSGDLNLLPAQLNSESPVHATNKRPFPIRRSTSENLSTPLADLATIKKRTASPVTVGNPSPTLLQVPAASTMDASTPPPEKLGGSGNFIPIQGDEV